MFTLKVLLNLFNIAQILFERTMLNHKLLLLTLFLSLTFSSFSQPIITSLSKMSGVVGTSVTINGTGFSSTSSDNIVFFGPVKATVSSSTTTSITVQVPYGGGTGEIRVINTNTNQTGKYRNPFSITYAESYTPSVNSFYYSSGTHDISVSAYINPRSSNAYTSHFIPIASGDFDGDGKVDVVKVNGSVTSGKGADVYLNSSSGNGNFSFGSAYNLSSSNDVGSVVVEDFNNDGKLDIAIGDNSSSNAVQVFKNSSTSGSLNFNTSSTTTVGASYVNRLTTADVNNDGLQDIIYAGSYASTISVALNTTSSSGGSITFGSAQTLISGLSGCRGFVIGDLNNDGADDIITAESTYKAWINNNTSSTISFASGFSIASGNYGWSSLIRDLNNDGSNDLIMSQLNSSGPKLFENSYSSGTISASHFGTAQDLSSASSQDGVLISDISGDGMPDLVSGTYYLKLSTNLMSTGSTIGGTSSSFSTITLNSTYTSNQRGILAEDFDGDGKIDILLHHALSSSNKMSIYENRNGEVKFYSKSTGNLHSTSTWGSNTDGTGSNPSNLTDISVGYQLANRSSFALTSDLTMSNIILDGTYPLDIANYDLTVGKVTGYASSSYIKTSGSGELWMSIPQSTPVFYPVGNSAYNPLEITNNSNATDDFGVRVFDEVYGSGTSGSTATGGRVKRTWDIHKNTANSGSGIDFKFYWNSGETVSLSTPALFHYSTSSSNWVKQTTGSTSYTSTSLTYTGYTGTFSQFAVGESSTTLPVELGDFAGIQKEDFILLNWKTFSEVNNDRFELEKWDDYLNDWVTIAKIRGHGTSNEVHNYSFEDKNVLRLNLYRLNQFDFDGRNYWSNVIRVLKDNSFGDVFNIFPNPSSNRLSITNHNLINRIDIHSIDGRILESDLPVSNSIDIRNLPNGIYYLQIYSDSEGISTQRFIKGN